MQSLFGGFQLWRPHRGPPQIVTSASTRSCREVAQGQALLILLLLRSSAQLWNGAPGLHACQ